jgi:putative transposase
MKDLLILLVHLLTTIAKLFGPGGAKAIVADSLLMKQQLPIMNRARRRVPNLSALNRFLLGFWSLFLSPRHIQRAAVIIRPSTLLKFHCQLKQRKYRLLYSAGRKGKPGPKGPSPELIQAIVELKRRNPRFGCPRIAQQINKAPVKPPATAQLSASSTGNLIVVGYISYLFLPEHEFAIDRRLMTRETETV